MAILKREVFYTNRAGFAASSRKSVSIYQMSIVPVLQHKYGLLTKTIQIRTAY